MTSIRWRFIILYLSVVVVAFVIVTIAAGRIIQDNLLNLRIDSTQAKVNDIAARIAPYVENLSTDDIYELIVSESQNLGGRILVVDKTGVVLMDSFSELNGHLLKQKEVLEVVTRTKDTSYGFHLLTSNTSPFWAVYYSSALVHNSDTIGAVVFSQNVQDIVEQTQNINVQFFLVYVVAIAIIAMATFMFTNHITQPINRLKAAAGEIAKGNFSQSIQIHGRSEIADLGNAFNIMTQQLENVDRQRSEFVSNASHELKTPLTSMKILVESILYQQGVSEDVYKEFLFDINDEIDRLTALINDLLLMTKMEGTELNIEEIYLDKLILRVIDALIPIANTKGVSISSELENFLVSCDTMRIRQAIYNLVENAIKYTKEGGHVNIRLEQLEGDAVVYVLDDGVGIGAADLPYIFDRFYRVDKARSRETGGTGLGLHIVKRIALLHKGNVSVNSTLGSGSEFILRVPVKVAKN